MKELSVISSLRNHRRENTWSSISLTARNSLGFADEDSDRREIQEPRDSDPTLIPTGPNWSEKRTVGMLIPTVNFLKSLSD